jgi:hypothetical protein
MSAEPTSPGEVNSGRDRLALSIWIFLGILTYRFASAALYGAITIRSSFLLFTALGRPNPVLAMTLVVAIGPLFPTFGYLATRYWLLPCRAQSWRNAVALPVIVLPCMVIASALSASVAALIVINFFPPLYQVTLSLPITGGLAGLCLAGIEKVTTLLLFGNEEAARIGPLFYPAHAVGIVVVLVAIWSPEPALSGHFFQAATTQPWGKRLVLLVLVCSEVVYLLLVWYAWGSRSAHRQPNFRATVIRLILTFVALSLIGAAIRLPLSPDPLQALEWPVPYFASFSQF